GSTGCQPSPLPDISSPIETRRFRGFLDMLNVVSSKARGEASMAAKNGSIKLVAGNSNPVLAQEIANWLHLPLTKASVRRFADNEIFVEILENVRGSDAFIIQSTSFPANDHLMELLIITDALRRSSARRITAVIPYFGYARQDRKVGSRAPITAKLVANLITHAGVDRAGYTCILIDDIVDSGGTLVNAADALIANGAKDVYAYISHGVLSGGAAARIAGSRLKELVITDSILPTEAVAKAGNIRTLSIAPLIAEAISRTASEESVSSLVD